MSAYTCGHNCGSSTALTVMTVWWVAMAACGSVGGACAATAPKDARAVLVAVFTVAASLCGLIVSVGVVQSGRAVHLTTSQILPLNGVQLRLDQVGALFVGVTAVVAIAVVIFNVGYSRRHAMSRTSACALPLFVLSMLLIPSAWSVMTFLFCWELMAVSSLVLVLSDYQRSASVRSAALWYAVLTQIGAATITFAMVLFAVESGSQSFSSMTLHSGLMSPAVRSTVFLLALAGFLSKAGAVPLHVWLPKAHAEAPSAVSALMSAAMVNVGIYGIIRVGDTLLGGGPAWWWIIVIALGAISAVFGSIHSATSTDLKRLLAYSTVDNIGLILIAVGTAGLLHATGHPVFAALALFAGLFHLVNHALFKGTLFLSAGSVLYATGTRDLDQLGGLFKRMPIASSIFAIGTVAITALPPLSGFVSEWLILQGLLHGISSSGTVSVVLMPLSVGALALTGGLTAAAFVKAFGVGFLGVARSSAAESALEPPGLMSVGSGLLAAFCVVIGVAPIMMVGLLNRVVLVLVGGSNSIVRRKGESFAVQNAHAIFDPSLIAIVLIVALGVAVGGRRILSRCYEVRRAPVWGSGRAFQTARMTYTATSFAEPLQRVFDDVLQPSHDLDISPSGESRYYVESVQFGTRGVDLFERHLYQPVFSFVRAIGNKARLLQNGSVHRYLAYSFIALLVVLLVAR
jgi:hydrogenase-4 component B